MAVKTAKQIEEERAAQLQGQEASAAAEMATRAQAPEEVEEQTAGGETASSDEEIGLWDEMLQEEEVTTSQSDIEEEPDDSDEATIETAETTDTDDTSKEGESAEEEAAQVETSTIAETQEGEVEVAAQPEQTTEDTRSPEEVKAEVEKAREGAKTKLAEQFKLTEAQEAALLENPNEVLPQMVADVYLDLFDNLVRTMQSQVPIMMQQTMQAQEQKKANEQKFFDAWPQLNMSKYMPTINRIADNYRNMNPNADPEEAVKEIGAQAWVALRLPLDELIKHTEGYVPQQQQASNNVTEFSGGRKPSGPGKASEAQNTPRAKPKNEFEQMADEFLLEDEM